MECDDDNYQDDGVNSECQLHVGTAIVVSTRLWQSEPTPIPQSILFHIPYLELCITCVDLRTE